MPQDETHLIDGLLLRAGDEYGEPVIGLRFVLPAEIAIGGYEGYDARRRPGIYLKAQTPNKSPSVKVRHDERLLTRPEAEEWARMVDRFAHLSVTKSNYPSTNLELVQMWYAALSRGLGRAIDANDRRRMDLRETYSALTGDHYRGEEPHA